MHYLAYPRYTCWISTRPINYKICVHLSGTGECFQKCPKIFAPHCILFQNVPTIIKEFILFSWQISSGMVRNREFITPSKLTKPLLVWFAPLGFYCHSPPISSYIRWSNLVQLADSVYSRKSREKRHAVVCGWRYNSSGMNRTDKGLVNLEENMKMSKLQCYLASKDIIHRDLATRNVLLTKDKIAKVDHLNLFF